MLHPLGYYLDIATTLPEEYPPSLRSAVVEYRYTYYIHSSLVIVRNMFVGPLAAAQAPSHNIEGAAMTTAARNRRIDVAHAWSWSKESTTTRVGKNNVQHRVRGMANT